MEQKIDEKPIAFIAGAGSGIGKSVAHKLASTGHFVICADLDGEAAKNTLHEFKNIGGQGTSFQLDVTDSEQYQSVISYVNNNFGYISKAINSAGITPKPARLGKNKIEDWKKVIDVNLFGIFNGMKNQIGSMIMNGQGSIVNLASIHGLVSAMGTSSYVASKHGVIGATKAAALEYANKNIRINAIAPGYVLTPLLKEASQESINDLISKHPLGRLANPEEIAESIDFMLSDKASFMTGSVMVVDGGYSLA